MTFDLRPEAGVGLLGGQEKRGDLVMTGIRTYLGSGAGTASLWLGQLSELSWPFLVSVSSFVNEGDTIDPTGLL